MAIVNFPTLTAATKTLQYSAGTVTFGADDVTIIKHNLVNPPFLILFEGCAETDDDTNESFTDWPAVYTHAANYLGVATAGGAYFVCKCHVAKIFNWVAIG